MRYNKPLTAYCEIDGCKSYNTNRVHDGTVAILQIYIVEKESHQAFIAAKSVVPQKDNTRPSIQTQYNSVFDMTHLLVLLTAI